ncbi:hypothetical protein [Pontibacter ruber]|uniref:Uncharacterized protein n=1 Tax=Pontibacter ruber TaxID=1343895 RepID=A0ABW5CYE1_9BACT|nr:hypothetical protein [Pontibacter ruber]
MKIILLLLGLLIGFCLACKATFDQGALLAKRLQTEATVASVESAIPSQTVAKL